MNYDDKILRILTEAGNTGLSVRKIARHVYNEANTFFNEVSFADVHHEVQQFLLRHSRHADSLVEHTDVRGHYRLNRRSPQLQQLMLQFADEEPETPEPPAVDQSLSLFDFL